jgi:opacity protein-like surface antigen
LYGGRIEYTASERTRFFGSLSEGLTPSGTGTITRSDSAGASLSHQFSDRLTGRLGVTYTRTKAPDGLTNVFTTKDYRGEIGVSYLLMERWRLDAGYRYSRSQYSQDPLEPKSNVAFLNIGYNWPGTSATDWIGRRSDSQGYPAAGPMSLPDRSQPASPEGSPCDRYSVP